MIAYNKAKVPKTVFFLLIYSPHEIKKFIIYTSAFLEASHKSVIWLREVLLSAILMISSFFVVNERLFYEYFYYCLLRRATMAAEPVLEAK